MEIIVRNGLETSKEPTHQNDRPVIRQLWYTRIVLFLKKQQFILYLIL